MDALIAQVSADSIALVVDAPKTHTKADSMVSGCFKILLRSCLEGFGSGCFKDFGMGLFDDFRNGCFD